LGWSTDDTTLYASSKNIEQLSNDVEEDLEILFDWHKANKLSQNIKITNKVYFIRRNMPHTRHIFKINAIANEKEEAVKFLRILIDEELY